MVSELSRNIGFIFDFMMLGSFPIFLLITFGWIIFCISQMRRSYHTLRYHRRNNYTDSTELYNSRNNLVRNILLLCIILAEFGNGCTVFLVQTLFADDWVSNSANITVNNCSLDKRSWLYDFESVSSANWFLEGLRQTFYIIELSLYRLTIHHLKSAYGREIFSAKTLLIKLIPKVFLSLIVLLLCSFSLTYCIGFGFSLIIIQVMLITCISEVRRFHLVVSWSVTDYEYYYGDGKQMKLRNILNKNKKATYLIYFTFQLYVISLFLYFAIVLVLQTILENSCWISANFYIQIPKLEVNKNIFSMVCNIVWTFRTFTAVIFSGLLSVLSLLYFCSVFFKRILTEIRVSNLFRFLYKPILNNR